METKDITTDTEIANRYGWFHEHRGSDGNSNYWVRLIDGSTEINEILRNPESHPRALAKFDGDIGNIADRVYEDIKSHPLNRSHKVLNDSDHTYYAKQEEGCIVHSRDMLLELHINRI